MHASDEFAAHPGDWYIRPDDNERVVVVAVEDWGFPVALLQYEDGHISDESLQNGDLPPGYEPFPSPNGRGPTVEDACNAEQHVFNAAPSKTPQTGIFCQDCRLSDRSLIEFAEQDVEALIDRMPALCYDCGILLEPGDPREFVAEMFLCPDCFDDRPAIPGV